MLGFTRRPGVVKLPAVPSPADNWTRRVLRVFNLFRSAPPARSWRNWQTRQVEGLVPVTGSGGSNPLDRTRLPESASLAAMPGAVISDVDRLTHERPPCLQGGARPGAAGGCLVV